MIDKVEFTDGEIRMGEHPLAFSDSQLQGAAELRIDLPREQPKAIAPQP